VGEGKMMILRQAQTIERTLQALGVPARVADVAYTRGCVRFAVTTAGAGSDVSKPLALALGRSVRTWRDAGVLQVEVRWR